MKKTTPLPRYQTSEKDLSNLSAVWVVEDRIEIAVRPVDIQREDSENFEQKFRQALARRPRELVVRLEAEKLSTGCLGVILRARADATREGVLFRLQPSSAAIAQMVRDLGVDKILGLAA